MTHAWHRHSRSSTQGQLLAVGCVPGPGGYVSSKVQLGSTDRESVHAGVNLDVAQVDVGLPSVSVQPAAERAPARPAANECASGAAEPPVIVAFLALRVPTSRVVAGPGSSPVQPPRGGSCKTSTAPSPPGSIGTELDQRRMRQAPRHGSDRRPPQRGRQALPAVRGGSPRPPGAPLVAPTCRTRAPGYSAVQPRSGMIGHGIPC